MDDYKAFKYILLLQKVEKNLKHTAFIYFRRFLFFVLGLFTFTFFCYLLSFINSVFSFLLFVSSIIWVLTFLLGITMLMDLISKNCIAYMSNQQFFKSVCHQSNLSKEESEYLYQILTESEFYEKGKLPYIDTFKNTINLSINFYWDKINNRESIQNLAQRLKDDNKLFFDNDENNLLIEIIDLYNQQVEKFLNNKKQMANRLEKAGIQIPFDENSSFENQKISIQENIG